MRVSFIIPALNESEHIDACLSSIESQLQDHDEIFVVDNGSRDGTIEIVRRHDRARHVVVTQVTVAALRNHGAKQTTGEVLAFIDADCTIADGWREAVLEILSREKVAATGTAVRIPATSGWIPRVWWYRKPGEERKTPYLVAANFAVRRDCFEQVGGFREDLITDEDTEIGTRLTKAGFAIIDSPKVGAVHHDNPRTLAEFYRKEKWHATSVLQTVTAQAVDKPMAMTILFWMSLMVAVVAVAAAVLYHQPLGWGVTVVMLVPLMTALYRISQGAKVSHLLPLIILYFGFYLARTSIIVRQLLRRRGDQLQGCF